MASTTSGTPVPSLATVFTIGGVQLSLRTASDCMARISRSTRSAPSRSDLLMTKMSAISMMPALMVCTSSPMPGTRMTTRDIGQRHDIHFVLADANGFDHDQVASAGVEHGGDIGGGAGQSAERAARGHAADVDARIGVMRLHANAVAENRSSAERAGGIDRHNADGLALLAILARDLIDQRALAGPGRAGQAEQHGIAAVREKRLQQFGRFRRAVFDDRDGTCQRAGIAAAHTGNEFLDLAAVLTD